MARPTPPPPPPRVRVTSFILLVLTAAATESSASTIKGPPTAPQRHIQQVARLGEEVKLVCPMDGRPAPFIEWYRGNEVIDFQWTRYRANKKSLKIKDVDKSDSGTLICKGVNGFGKEQVEINLIVIDPADFPGLEEGELPDVSPPRMTPDTEAAPATYEKRPGETLRIACGATGKPEPDIVWYKNGHEMLEHTRASRGRAVLLLRNLMARDEATYSCAARNLAGEARRDFSLRMAASLTAVTGPANTTVRGGDTAALECRVQSAERPHIKWLKKLEAGEGAGQDPGQVITVEAEQYRLIHASRDSLAPDQEDAYLSQLELRSVGPHQAGMYICFVTNSLGTFTHKGAFLTVIPNPPSLPGDSPVVLVLVVSLCVLVVLLLVAVVACVVRRRHKEAATSCGAADTEVRHNLMPGPAPDTAAYKCEQPLPPPPTPAPALYLYPGEGSVSGGSQYLNTYEVPHLPHYGAYPSYHHPPAPSLASSHVSSGRHVASHVPGGGYYAGQPI